jgi:hypothetical protein
MTRGIIRARIMNVHSPLTKRVTESHTSQRGMKNERPWRGGPCPPAGRSARRCTPSAPPPRPRALRAPARGGPAPSRPPARTPRRPRRRPSGRTATDSERRRPNDFPQRLIKILSLFRRLYLLCFSISSNPSPTPPFRRNRMCRVL